MKQGSKYLKVITVVLAVMVVSYILYNVAHSMRSGVATAQAVLFSASDSLDTEGLVIRQEEVLSAEYNLVLPMREEGEKVAAGSTVALSLRSLQARDRQDRILQIREDLQQLELALSYQSQLADNAAVTAKIDEATAVFVSQVADGRLDSAEAVGQSLKSLILRRELGTDDTAALEAQIEGLEQELQDLQDENVGEAKPVVAATSGYYSQTVDGYEAILTPEYASNMSIAEFGQIWDGKNDPEVPKLSAGRLIASPEWYYATLVPVKRLEKLSLGDTLTVVLKGESNRELEMTVVRLEKTGEEQGLLVLRCSRSLAAVSDLRRTEALVVFRSYSGVRVPKEAVCYDEEADTAGVYILENGRAIWKSVSLIFDVGDAYIAELDQTSTKNLWPGDLILPRTENLFDGKVVE